MMDTNLLGFLGVIVTLLVVGVALGGLVLKLHNDTNRRIDALTIRVSELEKSVARIEGYLAGLPSASSQATA